MTEIVNLLEPVESEERKRIIAAALTLLGESSLPKGLGAPAQQTSEAGLEGLPSKVQLWMKQNDVSKDQLDLVFHVEDMKADVIAGEIPGTNNKTKVLNAYLLAGLASFLPSGETSFADKGARDLCTSLGFYDHTNHSKYLKEKGNLFTGTKDAGWTLTAPGLKAAATLVKELAQ